MVCCNKYYDLTKNVIASNYFNNCVQIHSKILSLTEKFFMLSLAAQKYLLLP